MKIPTRESKNAFLLVAHELCVPDPSRMYRLDDMSAYVGKRLPGIDIVVHPFGELEVIFFLGAEIIVMEELDNPEWFRLTQAGHKKAQQVHDIHKLARGDD